MKAPLKMEDGSEEEIPLLVPMDKMPAKVMVEVYLLILNIPSGLIEWSLCQADPVLSDECYTGERYLHRNLLK